MITHNVFTNAYKNIFESTRRKTTHISIVNSMRTINVRKRFTCIYLFGSRFIRKFTDIIHCIIRSVVHMYGEANSHVLVTVSIDDLAEKPIRTLN